jgi:hypothetical protein
MNQGNIVIAEFMEHPTQILKGNVLHYGISVDAKILDNLRDTYPKYSFVNKWRDYEGFEYNNLMYHESWDWLMTVIDKLEKKKKLNGIVPFVWSTGRTVQGENFCIIVYEDFNNKAKKYKRMIKGDGKLDTTYLAIVTFLEWLKINK